MYCVRIIDTAGPGDTLSTHDTAEEARAHIDETGCAYYYHYGVAIEDTDSSTYDCGDGEWVAADEC